ncbi:hypothetical protein B0H66DRAFT_597405 [Apodospora peruviana]|uniref:Uncharacterized protein n=1 Tax=Apodospora peruviana TaxID=516989 RepID=A0AAE0MF16_9PEZI|nr:hypothetical protein B0H66DRAFT_597405 [Apodospora peruviana]
MASLSSHLLLVRRNWEHDSSSFPSSTNFPSSHDGLHPAAIFGIVAGVMVLLSAIMFFVWFRFMRKVLTNKEYGVLPSIRTAANNHGAYNGGYAPYGNGPSYGQEPPRYPHHGGGSEPAPYPVAPPAHLSSSTEPAAVSSAFIDIPTSNESPGPGKNDDPVKVRVATAPASRTERLRVMRAFYRRQIFSNAWAPKNVDGMWSARDVAVIRNTSERNGERLGLLAPFQPWEKQQEATAGSSSTPKPTERVQFGDILSHADKLVRYIQEHPNLPYQAFDDQEPLLELADFQGSAGS